MDVSGWTIEQRMRFPDYCFGNRMLMGLSYSNSVAGSTRWRIHTTVLPAQICIWQTKILWRAVDSTMSFIRFGFRATLPTTQAQMDSAIPVLPDFGDVSHSPPRVWLPSGGHEVWAFDLRKGMATSSLKLTLEIYAQVAPVTVLFAFVYSLLPTDMAGWLAHNKV